MEGTCNECVFPLNKEDSEAICATYTSLVYAARRGKLSCAKELIAAGADVNIVCELDSGAKMDVKSNLGRTALTLASKNGHVECLHELVAAGADVNSQNNN